MQFAIHKNGCGTGKLFQSFWLVRHDNHRGSFQPLAQQVTCLAVKFHISGPRHTFVDQVNVEIQRQQKRKEKRARIPEL